jgi:hypothetical protein
MIAALYVETDGTYFGLDNVDPWDQQRDARLYHGPYPVVAHPPCGRWGMLASVNQKRWGAMIGDDEGCFQAALASVRQWGGVLEHPAYSLAWTHFGLPRPVSRGGWTSSMDDAGYSIEVSQSAYGHKARKRTWLYAVDTDLPELLTGDPRGEHVIGAGVHSGQAMGRGRVAEPLKTPIEFRDVLISIAESAKAAV